MSAGLSPTFDFIDTSVSLPTRLTAEDAMAIVVEHDHHFRRNPPAPDREPTALLDLALGEAFAEEARLATRAGRCGVTWHASDMVLDALHPDSAMEFEARLAKALIREFQVELCACVVAKAAEDRS